MKITHYVRVFAGNAHNLAHWPEGGPKRAVKDKHGRQLYQEEGKAVIEKIPSAPHVVCLSPAGNETFVVVRCGSGKPQMKDLHGDQKIQEKMDKGFFPKANCPKELGLSRNFHPQFPEELLESAPCQNGSLLIQKTDKKTKEVTYEVQDVEELELSLKHPCRCYRVEKQLRQKMTKANMLRIEGRRRTDADKDRAAREAETEVLREAVKQLAKKATK